MIEYETITHHTADSFSNFLHVTDFPRAKHCLLALAYPLPIALDTIIGLGAALGSLVTFGHAPVFKFAERHLAKTTNFFSEPCFHLLGVINPRSKFKVKFRGLSYFVFENACFDKTLQKHAQEFRNSDNWLKRHVASRLTYAVNLVAVVVGCVVDAILCIPLAIASMVTFGKFQWLNEDAYAALGAPGGLIYDLFYGLSKMINPWAGMDEALTIECFGDSA